MATQPAPQSDAEFPDAGAGQSADYGPVAGIAAALKTGDVAAAEALLDRVRWTRRDDDGLSALSAIVDYRRGRIAEALAGAWSTSRRFGQESEVSGLVARALAASGEPRLARRKFADALAADPENGPLHIALLALLAEHDPPAARRHIARALSCIGAAEAVGLLPLAHRLGLRLSGVCRWRDGRLEGWIVGRFSEGRAPALPADCFEGRAWRDRDLPVQATSVGPGITAFGLDWPPEARALRLYRKRGERTLAGGRLHAPALVQTPMPRRPDGAPLSPVVTVVVPVHGGANQTLACLQSVLSARNDVPLSLVVIDDASPDPDLRAVLERMASLGKLRLVTHRTNRGFTASANAGLALDPDRDAVLLNADTVVADGWLDRMVAAARSAPDIATVTPLTNNGQHVSHPVPHRDQPMPARSEIARLAALAAEVNAGPPVTVPVGAGFCLLIRRDCLDRIGALDEPTFGRGYGEETDFSLRAVAAGWRNVCATDVFVGHHGSQSFGPEKTALVRRNMARIARRHPAYRAEMDAFDTADPLAPARRRLARAALAPPRRPVRLVLTPAQATPDGALASLRAAARADGAVLWQIRPAPTLGAGIVLLSEVGVPGPGPLRHRLPTEAEDLVADISRLAPDVIDVLGPDVPESLLHAMGGTGIRLLMHLPPDRLAAIMGGEEPPADAGEAVALTLARAGAEVVPAEAQAFAVSAVSGSSPPTATADGPQSAKPDERRSDVVGRIAVVGDTGSASSEATLLRLAREAATADGPLQFFVLGSALAPAALERTGRVRVLGPVERPARRALARALGCGLALVLPGGPAGSDGASPWALRAAAETCPRLAVLGGAPAQICANASNITLHSGLPPDVIHARLVEAAS